MVPQRIAYAHERQVVGTLLLNLLFPIFEHNEAHLKRHFGASLETMTVGIAVLLMKKLRELAAAGVVTKEGGHYVANYEVFATTDPETAAHINRLREAILSACEKLGDSDHQQRRRGAEPAENGDAAGS